MVFRKNNATEFGWDGLKGWAYNSKEQFDRASAAYFEVTGSHGPTVTTLSDRVYLVLDGQGQFDIDEQSTDVDEGDVVIIPKGSIYDYRATSKILKLYLVHTPAYDPSFDEKPEEY